MYLTSEHIEKGYTYNETKSAIEMALLSAPSTLFDSQALNYVIELLKNFVCLKKKTDTEFAFNGTISIQTTIK